MAARVLWLTKGLGRGGAEALLSLLGRHIDRDRYDVEVAYLLPHKDALVAAIAASGIPVHCLGGGTAGGTAWVPRLRRLVLSRRYHLVHTHSPLAAAGARLALPRGVRLVHTEHNVWQRYRRPTYVANAATYRRNAAVIAVSRGVADSIRLPPWVPGRAGPRVEVLYHGADVARVRSGPDAAARARRLLGLGADEPVIGSVANFTPKKDQRTLLRALERLSVRVPGVRLVLVGAGPLEAALRSQAAHSGLDGQVLFTGSRGDVQDLLPAFDVFVLSSLHEGLSISLIEAMAAGLPAVATRVGGVPELLEDGEQGLLVPARDPVALADATAWLLQDPALAARMGRQGAEQARNFSIRTAAERLQAVYDRVLAA